MSGLPALSALRGIYAAGFEAAMALAVANFPGVPHRLMEAMAYSLKAGGKRLRPVLCLAAADACGGEAGCAMPMALAIEFMHTASLIHDDLPCMDDDDLRRGKPTNHKIFGEAMALLAGDSLMIWSFGVALSGMSERGVPSDRAARAAAILSDASGPRGMCGGQALDIDAESADRSGDFVHRIAEKKTAALIRASVTAGAVIGGCGGADLARWEEYGARLGLAFQIVDDILDATGTAEQLGKTPGKDEAQNKITFVSTYGLDSSRRRAREESEAAAAALSGTDWDCGLLIDLARELAGRSN
jgi:geranylgeranyl diphosphate synthase type II